MDASADRDPDEVRRFALLLLSFFALWGCWAALLVASPDPWSHPAIRFVVRLAVWIVPVLLFVTRVEGRPFLDAVGLVRGARRGVLAGIGMSVVYLGAVLIVRVGFGGAVLEVPTSLAVWLNPILSVPLAEETLFRGLVFRKLDEYCGSVAATLGSALLFAAIHFPYWFLSGAKTGGALATSLGEMFLYGVGFALIYRATRSLWAPLIFHSLNNLVASSIRG